MRRKLMASQLVVVMLVGTSAAFAQGKSTTSQSQSSTLPGTPFQEMQTQLSAIELQLQAMSQQIQALQTQINSVESNLQSQINTINATLVSLQTQITDGAAATASLAARVTANEASIAALQAAVAALQAQLDTAQTLIAGQAGDITALQGQANSLQTLINAHTSQITALQQQTAALAQFQANLVNGNCQTGEAIRDIAPGGFIVCTQAGGGSLQTVTRTAGAFLFNGTNYVSVSCPAGYVATGSGFSVPSFYESQQYVSGVSFTFAGGDYSTSRSIFTGTGNYPYWDSDADTFTYPAPSFGYKNSSPFTITQSLVNNGSVSLQVQYLPQVYYGGYFAQVQATCSRVQ